MNKSESIKKLAAALNKFQASISGAKKKSKNPFFKSNYADLKEVIECAKEALSENGLSYSQFPISAEGKAGVRTILMHESGEWMEDTLLLACVKQDPQAYGSAITYARRYALQAILGIPSEDDDGNNATFITDGQKKSYSSEHISNEMNAFKEKNIGLKPLEESLPKKMNAITEKQRKTIFAICKSLNMKPEDGKTIMQSMFNKSKSEELTVSEASEMIEKLKEMESGNNN